MEQSQKPKREVKQLDQVVHAYKPGTSQAFDVRIIFIIF